MWIYKKCIVPCFCVQFLLLSRCLNFDGSSSSERKGLIQWTCNLGDVRVSVYNTHRAEQSFFFVIQFREIKVDDWIFISWGMFLWQLVRGAFWKAKGSWWVLFREEDFLKIAECCNSLEAIDPDQSTITISAFEFHYRRQSFKFHWSPPWWHLMPTHS